MQNISPKFIFHCHIVVCDPVESMQAIVTFTLFKIQPLLLHHLNITLAKCCLFRLLLICSQSYSPFSLRWAQNSFILHVLLCCINSSEFELFQSTYFCSFQDTLMCYDVVGLSLSGSASQWVPSIPEMLDFLACWHTFINKTDKVYTKLCFPRRDFHHLNEHKWHSASWLSLAVLLLRPFPLVLQTI